MSTPLSLEGDNSFGVQSRFALYLYWTACPARAAVVHLNFRAGSTFPVPVCTIPNSMDRTSQRNKVDAVKLYASYRLNLLLLKGQRWVRDVRHVWLSFHSFIICERPISFFFFNRFKKLFRSLPKLSFVLQLFCGIALAAVHELFWVYKCTQEKFACVGNPRELIKKG